MDKRDKNYNFWAMLAAFLIFGIFFLGVLATPEGSETISHKSWLIWMACPLITGFFFGFRFAISQIHKHVMKENLSEDERKRIIGKILP